MTDFTDSSLFERGSIGEQNVATFLKENGWAVVPTHECNPGDAALMRGMDKSFILPDLLSFDTKRAIWIEVKTKEKPRLYKKRNEYRHCIDEYQYREYLQVESLTGSNVWLFVYEENTDKILRAPVNWLPVVQTLPPEDSNGAFDNTVVFFRRNDFIDTGIIVAENGIRTGKTGDRALRNPPPNDPFAE